MICRLFTYTAAKKCNHPYVLVILRKSMWVDVQDFWRPRPRYYLILAGCSLSTEKFRNLKIFSLNSRGYLKNHCTNTRLVCTHLNAILYHESKYGNKKLNFENFGKKVLTCCLLLNMLHVERVKSWIFSNSISWKLPLIHSVQCCIVQGALCPTLALNSIHWKLPRCTMLHCARCIVPNTCPKQYSLEATTLYNAASCKVHCAQHLP